MDELTQAKAERDEWRELAETQQAAADDAIATAAALRDALAQAHLLTDRLQAENESLSRELLALSSKEKTDAFA